MKYALILLLSFTLGVCISCGDEDCPVCPEPTGTTATFEIGLGTLCNPEAANNYCYIEGYEESTGHKCTDEKQGYYGHVDYWITEVTCYKP